MVRSTFFTAVVIAAGAGFVHGQSIGDMLSSSCQQALLDVAASPEASCLNVEGFVSFVVSAITSTNDSLIEPATFWLTNFCGETPCSDQALSDITTNLTTGCNDDLTSLFGSMPSTSDIVSAVQNAYPTVQSIMCLTDMMNNTFCATDMLDDLQSTFGQLSVDNILQQLPSIMAGDLTTSSLPMYFMCSDCAQAAYSMLQAADPDLADASFMTNELTSQCGASMLNATMPSDVIVATGTMASLAIATSTSDSGSTDAVTDGALDLTSNSMVGVAVSLTATLITAFAMLS